ncbi:restriction endonuclease subunit S [uncultured Streptococcus sp.]|uniref:restriction endonuclease subunit S n=1 Tax=uncultured Streptococcus sp. TaxID=83427 RepID=UPI00261E3181|nr:restriction endonuclease subunit S [uncultured Streptococcus sp.]
MTRMKESGIDWIGQIPEEWESGKVKYFSKISAGATPDRNNLLFWNGDINWMSSGEVNQEIVKYTAETITNLALKNSSTKLLPIGTVMLAMNGQGKTKGTVAILAIETASNQSLASFIVDGNRLNNQYLYYFFKAGYSYIRGLKGEDRDGLNLQLVSNITVPLFDIKEQQKIADFLDKKTTQLDKVKSLLEEQIQKLKDYRASLIYETVTKGLDKAVPMKDSGIDWIGQVPQGWGVKPLKYLASYDDETLTQSEINSNRKIDYVDISSVEFTKGINGHQEFSTLEAPSRARKIAKKGDTIISTVRTYLKAIAYVNNDYIVSTGFCVVRPKKINSKYLNYTIMSDSFTGPVSKYAWGVSYPAISSSQLVNIPIPFPESIEEQLSIVDYLDHKMLQINHLIDIKQEQIENINKQRQTLIYDYVTGKRRV